MIRRHLVNDALARPCRGEAAAADKKRCGVIRHGGDIGPVHDIVNAEAKRPPVRAAFPTPHLSQIN